MAPRSPPAMIDDLIVDILLRLPPDDTACLTRASLVSKAWRRLLADRDLHRQYREIHGAPPFPGFLYNNFSIGAGAFGPLFLRTTQPSPFPQPAPPAGSPTYCASGGCDHLDCSGGPFNVVVVAKTYPDAPDPWPPAPTAARASLYSSQTGKWTVSATIDLQSFSIEIAPSLLAGDAIFFALAFGKGVLKYDLSRGVLSLINLPLHARNMILCTGEDGGLGVAAMEGSSQCLWSCRTDSYGVWRWALDRAMRLDWKIPIGFGDLLTNKFHVVGFAEGTDYIFVRVNDIIFSVEMKSRRMNKIGSGKFGPIFPFMRF